MLTCWKVKMRLIGKSCIDLTGINGHLSWIVNIRTSNWVHMEQPASLIGYVVWGVQTFFFLFICTIYLIYLTLLVTRTCYRCLNPLLSYSFLKLTETDISGHPPFPYILLPDIVAIFKNWSWVKVVQASWRLLKGFFLLHCNYIFTRFQSSPCTLPFQRNVFLFVC